MQSPVRLSLPTVLDRNTEYGRIVGARIGEKRTYVIVLCVLNNSS